MPGTPVACPELLMFLPGTEPGVASWWACEVIECVLTHG